MEKGENVLYPLFQEALRGLKRLRTEVTMNSHFAILTTIMEPIDE